MIQSGVLGAHGFRNSSTSKFCVCDASQIGQHEERVVSFASLNESPRTAVSPIRASCRINVLGSRR